MPEGIIHSTYYATHEYATPAERKEGRKLGRITDMGYMATLPNGERIKISTFGWDFESREEVKDVVEGIIQKRAQNPNVVVDFS